MNRFRSGRCLRARLLFGALFALLLPFVGTAGSEQAPPLVLVGDASPEEAHGLQQAVGAVDNESGAPGGFDPFDLIFLCVPGYFLLQAALTYGTSGGWRKATLVPAVIMVPILAYTVLAFAAQSNLWPLLLLLGAPLGFLYLVFLGLFLLLRRLAGAA